MCNMIKCEYDELGKDECGKEAVRFFRIKKYEVVLAHCEIHTPFHVGWASYEYEEISRGEYVVEDCLWLCEH